GFTGTLEGNGHTVIFDNVDTITPLVINGDEYVGLVGKNNGTIKDVIVEGSFEYTAIGSGNVYMGSIAGTNDGGTIIRSKSDADIKLIINASYNIIGAIGGIVGDHRNGTVEEVASLGNVTLEHSGQGAGRPNNNGYAGGIVGRIAVNGVVKNSYSAGDISNRVVSSDSNGYREIGGIAGSVYNDGALIENCFTTSNLFGSNDPVKGLVGTIVGFDGGGTWTLKNTAGLNASMTGAASKGAPYARTWSTTSNMVVMNAFHSSSLGVTTHMSGDRSVSVGSTQQDLNNFWISSLGFDASVWRWNASEKRPELAWE
ncbi:MAG: hypothetical protein LBG61_02980, partial [Burkholderiales bacterium]|nr:hypothetical protein [Burkholderiales bacterium]